MKKRVFDIFVWLVTLIFIAMIFIMPDTIPIHWDSQWNVDSYGSRYTLLILAFLPLAIHYGMLLMLKIDPRHKNLEKRQATYNIFRYGLTAFFMTITMFFYYLTLNPQSNIENLFLLLIGVIFIGMGNYMPRVPQNYFLGIKTPWTLSNEYVWKKTHRIGGYLWIIIGMIIVMIGFIHSSYAYNVLLVLVISDVIFMMIYSYIIYKRIDTKDIDDKII